MSDTHTATPDAEAELLRAAWAKAVITWRQWTTVHGRCRVAARQGSECVHVHDATERDRLRTILDDLVTRYGWQRTYVDPMVSDAERAAYLTPNEPTRLPDFVGRPRVFLPRFDAAGKVIR